MTKEHPVVPPKHLLDEWCSEYVFTSENFDELLIRAAQWGADEELNRCCALIEPEPCCGTKHQRRMLVRKLIERRRPQPKKVSMTVSITGTEAELESLFQTLANDREVSIQFR
jgi:hypothetical protein